MRTIAIVLGILTIVVGAVKGEDPAPERLGLILVDRATMTKEEMAANAKSIAKSGAVKEKSTKLETRVFKGWFLCARNTTCLAALSDDGVDVIVRPLGGQESTVLNRFQTPQHLPKTDESLNPEAIIKLLSESGNDPRAGVRTQILFLADIQGTPGEVPFYEACLEKMAKGGGKAEISALERLINSKLYWSNHKSPTDDIIAMLMPRASKLWYDLVWAGADDKTKRETALYGFQPTPPVRPEHWECFARVMQLGKAVRPQLYSVLMRPNAKMDSTRWTLASVATAVDLLEDPNFAPSPAEVKALLKDSGSFGLAIGLGYSAKTSAAGFPDAFDSFVTKNMDDPWQLYHVGYYARFARKLGPDGHAQLTQTIVKMGREAQKQISQPGNKPPKVAWFEVLYNVNMLLDDVDPGPVGKEYLKAYQDFQRRLNMDFLQRCDQKYQGDVTASLKAAAERAESALSKP